MKTRSGFTLIELSIVLVIIGLIIGGILLGRDLIHAAEVRKTITQIEQTKTAVATFEGKYNCLPGDCANASSFFSGAINGYGDGQIYQNPAYPGYALGPYNAWSQLSAAGLIAGSVPPMDDVAWNSNYDIQNFMSPPTAPQLLAPSAALAGSFLTLYYFQSAGTYYPNLSSGNYVGVSRIPYGDDMASDGLDIIDTFEFITDFWGPGASGLYPQDALAIDTKMDDGLPLTGSVSVVSYTGDGFGCITQSGSPIYDMSAAGNTGSCVMFIPLGM